MYFGEESAKKYAEKVTSMLGGKIITKSIEHAREDCGLIKEAERLGMDMWELLEAIEGMCYLGKAKELDDTRYYIIPQMYKITIWDSEGIWTVETDNLEKIKKLLETNNEDFKYEAV